MSHEFPRPAGDSWLAPAAVTSERRNNETRMGVDGRAAWREAIVRGRACGVGEERLMTWLSQNAEKYGSRSLLFRHRGYLILKNKKFSPSAGRSSPPISLSPVTSSISLLQI